MNYIQNMMFIRLCNFTNPQYLQQIQKKML